MSTTCKFHEGWKGVCKSPCTGDYCDKHKLKCISCGGTATHSCPETGQFVCGAALCDECEHTICEDGTNGGIGFFQTSPVPEGMGSHCKKTEQVYQPWYRRSSNV